MVVSSFDVIKHMLSMPILNGRIGKWILALSEFNLRYESAKAVKGQIIADFITQHRDLSVEAISIVPWALFFDGSSCNKGGGAGILLISPQGKTFEYAVPIEFHVTNNQAEYEALLRGLQLLIEVKAVAVEIFGDSELVINQLNGQYDCKNNVLREYYEECRELLKNFLVVTLHHIPRECNEEANKLAQAASGYRESREVFAMEENVSNTDQNDGDWRCEITNYLKDPSQKVSRKLRYKALKFVFLDDQLYYKSVDGVLLKCLSQEEAKKVMYEVHEGLCGAHQSAYRMKWIIRRTGYFWPTMLEDCFEYYKGCHNC